MLPSIRRRRAFVAGLVAVVALAACGSDTDRPQLQSKQPDQPTDAPTTTPPAFTSSIAQALVPKLKVFDTPESAEPSRVYENPWHVNDDPAEPTVPLVFLVEKQRDDGWIRVLLPERPNGTLGWARADEFHITTTQYHVTIALAEHQITVYDGESVVLQEPAAIGKPETPTPPGKYYIRVLLQSTDPGSVYGPFAYGLSAHSEVLTSFNGGDGEVGIHGNNDPSVLGQSVSAGCVRMSNEGITRLTQLLPLGTPVEIVR